MSYILFLIHAAFAGFFAHHRAWGWAAFMALVALGVLASMIVKTLERGLA